MRTPLRVLMVEDCIGDVMMLLDELRRCDFDPVSQRVDTESGMVAALRSGEWDVILSEYRLPEFSGLDALAILKKSGLDIPFIIVSGTIGEINAVEAMKAGASDYVMKDSLLRLAPAIRRELVEAAKRDDLRASDTALRESEERFRTMADSAPALIWLTDESGNFTYVNRPLIEFFDRPLEEIVGEGWIHRVHPDDLDRVRREYAESADSLQPYKSQFRLLRSDGEWRWIVATSAPHMHLSGSYAGHVGMCIDITEGKRAEDEREIMREQNEQLLHEKVTAALQQRAFLRDVLSSVTEGKLRLCDAAVDLPRLLGEIEEAISVTAESLGSIRIAVRKLARSRAMNGERIQDLITAVNEAGMNAVVHAGGGRARLCGSTDCVQVWIEDGGKGIDVKNLPKATLERGYTTSNTFGHGFFMILASVDRLYMLTGADGTTVVLEQQRVPPEPAWFTRMPLHGGPTYPLQAA